MTAACGATGNMTASTGSPELHQWSVHKSKIDISYLTSLGMLCGGIPIRLIPCAKVFQSENASVIF